MLCGVNQQAAVSQRYAASAVRTVPAVTAPVTENDETLPYRPVQVTE